MALRRAAKAAKLGESLALGERSAGLFAPARAAISARRRAWWCRSRYSCGGARRRAVRAGAAVAHACLCPVACGESGSFGLTN
jgi:hypothetical protein